MGTGRVVKVPVGGPITSSPAWVDVKGRSGCVVVGGPDLRVVDRDGLTLPGWPVKGRRPFASSPAVGEIHRGRGPSIVIGCDDHWIYSFSLEGRGGRWLKTGLDVFSTPCIADLYGEGVLSMVVGSDDGSLHGWDEQCESDGWGPVDVGSFISSSPTILASSRRFGSRIAFTGWDRMIHCTGYDGKESGRWPFRLPSLGWSSVAVLRTPQERLLATCADSVYVLRDDGALLPGWSRSLASWTPSTPAWCLHGDDAYLLAASDRGYAFDIGGNLLRGWPKEIGGFGWPSPIDIRIAGRPFGVFGSWGGSVVAHSLLGPDSKTLLETGGRIASTPAVTRVDGTTLLAVGSWDGNLYIVELGPDVEPGTTPMFRVDRRRGGVVSHPADIRMATPARTDAPAAIPVIAGAHPVEAPRPGEPWSVAVEGERLEAAAHLVLVYRILGERRAHPSPFVLHSGARVAMVQPLRAGHLVSYHVEWETRDGRNGRWPRRGEKRQPILPERMERAVRHLRGGAETR